jgi:hypothetical protein
MQRGPRSSNGGNKNAVAIVKSCQQELVESGFDNRKGTMSWRRANLKFDLLKFDIISSAHCKKWRIPLGSLGLEPSCLFPFLPRMGDAPNDRTLRPEIGFGQIRLKVNRGIVQPSVKSANIWWAGDDSTLDLVMSDILSSIREKVLPFFSRFEDADELLRTCLEDDDAIGREGAWDFGRRGSPTRLLYTGFSAIQCAKWDLAISFLTACKERTEGIPEPVGQSVGAQVLP